jgi:GNAT superfamily N-acetyltransferase
MPDPRIEDLERAAVRHWQAPDTQELGGWLLRAAAGFTGRANSALPLGDPGLPLAEAVTAVEEWYRRRRLPPMIVLPQVLDHSAGPDPLEVHVTERAWLPRPGPAFVMTADVAGIPASDQNVELAPEPDAAFLGTSGLAVAAARRGARRILLQTETGNAPARALYVRCGFRDSHRYYYRIAPPADSEQSRHASTVL